MNLTTLTDDALFIKAVSAVNAAAAGEARGGDDGSYNHAMAVLAESQRRLELSGHDKWCQSGVYNRAFVAASGFGGDTTCTCGPAR